MIYEGTIHNGVVVFQQQPPLAEGTRVRVEPVESSSQTSSPNGRRSVWEVLEELAGRVEGLPEDSAEKHAEYRRRRLGL